MYSYGLDQGEIGGSMFMHLTSKSLGGPFD